MRPRNPFVCLLLEILPYCYRWRVNLIVDLTGNVRQVVSSMCGNTYPQEIEKAFLGSDGLFCKRGVNIDQHRCNLEGISILCSRIIFLYIFAVLPFSTGVLREKSLRYMNQIGFCIRYSGIVRSQASEAMASIFTFHPSRKVCAPVQRNEKARIDEWDKHYARMTFSIYFST